MAEGDLLLEVKGVSQKLGGNQILKGVSFEVRDRVRPGATTGQVLGLLGPSGVGKTRLLRLIAGLDAPDEGSIRGRGGAALPAGSVGVVFQNYVLLRHHTVMGNLLAAGAANGMTAADTEKRARELLERFGLADRANFYPAQLSGGQRQRVAIAQQVVHHKSVLVMDEPFSGLDPSALDEVIDLVVEVAHHHEHNTIIVITHDIRAALLVSDTLLTLGRERTPTGQVIPGAHIRKTYDLLGQGLAWRRDLEGDPRFEALERDIKAGFRTL